MSHAVLEKQIGFDRDVTVTDHNLRLLDALEYAKKGTLGEELDKLFGAGKQLDRP